MKEQQEISQDSLFNGELVCYQSKHGYRFSIDAVLLAHFCQDLRRSTILDLGCGCGVIAMILLYRKVEDIVYVHGIEYQSNLAALAEKNGKANNIAEKFTITLGDYTTLPDYYGPESFTHVICNPPFYSVGKGRPSANEENYWARHQVHTTIDDIARNVAYVLKNKGLFAIIYPADQISELLSALLNFNLQPKKIQFVYSYPGAATATLVLAEFKKNGGSGVKVTSPLFIYRHQKGPYSDEVAKMYQPNSIVFSGCNVS